MSVATCPVCDTRIPVEQGTDLFERIRCPECGALLEFTAQEPFLVDWVSEGWEYDDSAGVDSYGDVARAEKSAVRHEPKSHPKWRKSEKDN